LRGGHYTVLCPLLSSELPWKVENKLKEELFWLSVSYTKNIFGWDLKLPGVKLFWLAWKRKLKAWTFIDWSLKIL
jgi:hypothetical protein